MFFSKIKAEKDRYLIRPSVTNPTVRFFDKVKTIINFFPKSKTITYHKNK